MLIDKNIALAIRCSKCGLLDIHQLNIFHLSGQKKVSLRCECGHRKITLFREIDDINFSPYCLVCGKRHDLKLDYKKFWTKNIVRSLNCPRTGLNLGYYGPYYILQSKIDRQQKELELLAAGLGFDDFTDPEIMLSALDILHDFAAEGSLNCECGSKDIGIDLSKDVIHLNCFQCPGQLDISAVNLADLKFLENSTEIVLKYKSNKSPLNPSR
ncbi:hypothetical protein I0Q91_10030 [Halanaerobiaceae bacterium Z-7014]|uniref:Uncharacterized protein n=1 Tax=Halonatronomonas betaini TaxID=2778430 RepID=A0A931ASN2_9FIRM|nr:hypothetical protein [Halonatronomonas betaini]MBF8437419.1 hypothetical protein [Halonatronomonas betaini]